MSAHHLDLEVSEEPSQSDVLSLNSETHVEESLVRASWATRLDVCDLNILDRQTATAWETQMHSQFIQTLRTCSIEKTRELISQKADVNCLKSYPCFKTALHHAVESGDVSLISLLLQHKANVNAASEGGTTPLHCAVKQFTSLAMVVLQMLMCARADLSVPDETGATPLLCAQKVVLSSLHSMTTCSQLSRDNQLVHELAQQPTIAVHVAEAQELQCATFWDLMGEKVAFHTASAVGVYSSNAQNCLHVRSFRTLPKGSSVR